MFLYSNLATDPTLERCSGMTKSIPSQLQLRRAARRPDRQSDMKFKLVESLKKFCLSI